MQLRMHFCKAAHSVAPACAAACVWRERTVLHMVGANCYPNTRAVIPTQPHCPPSAGQQVKNAQNSVIGADARATACQRSGSESVPCCLQLAWQAQWQCMPSDAAASGTRHHPHCHACHARTRSTHQHTAAHKSSVHSRSALQGTRHDARATPARSCCCRTRATHNKCTTHSRCPAALLSSWASSCWAGLRSCCCCQTHSQQAPRAAARRRPLRWRCLTWPHCWLAARKRPGWDPPS